MVTITILNVCGKEKKLETMADPLFLMLFSKDVDILSRDELCCHLVDTQISSNSATQLDSNSRVD